MKIKLYLAISASALALQCGAAQAQDYYVGLGLSATDGTGERDGGPVSAGDISWNNASIFAGVRFNRSTPLFYGAEIETSVGGFSSETRAGGGSKVNPDRVSRLRAVVGYKYEKFSVFGALGAVRMDATNFFYGSDASGVTFGLGVEIPVSSRIDIRLEAIHDKMDASGSFGYNQDYSNNSIRIGAMMKF